jgi:hypothetical protein
VVSALEAIKKKGYFKASKEADKAYAGHHSRINQAKAQLAKLDDSTDGEAGTSKQSTKKINVTTAEASPADPALHVGSCYKIGSRTVSSLVAECLIERFMR